MTKIEFKDVAGFYLGCKVLPSGSRNIHTLNPHSYYNVLTFRDKPLLYPLSSLTKEQVLHLANMLDDSEFVSIDYHCDGVSYEVKTSDGVAWMFSIDDTFNAEQFLWLCNNHFDLFNLISNGQAIDVTKLEANPYL